MTYLITGATGNIGSRVVEQLIGEGHRPRVLVRDTGKARQRFADRVEIFAGDLAYADSLRPGLRGVGSLLLINAGPELAERDAAVAIVAKKAGVRHIVKVSALSAAQEIAIGEWHA